MAFRAFLSLGVFIINIVITKIRNLIDYYYPSLYLSKMQDISGDVSDLWVLGDQQKKKWVLKCYPEWVEIEGVVWVHDFLKKLKNRSFSLPKVMDNIYQKQFTSYNGRFYAVFEFLNGTLFQSESLGQIINSARKLGELHLVSKRMQLGDRPGWWVISKYPFEKKIGLLHSTSWLVDDMSIIRKSVHLIIDLLENNKAYNKQIQIGLHGDFHGENIKYNGEKVVGVFDWDNSRRDIPEIDLAKPLRRLCGFSKGKQIAFLRSYKKAVKGEININAEVVMSACLMMSVKEAMYLAEQFKQTSQDFYYNDLLAELNFLKMMLKKKRDHLSLYKEVFH